MNQLAYPAEPELLVGTLVSVVIPARNAAMTLAETLQSLQAQSHQNWEALVVDDGSTDETASIIATFARRDRRIVPLKGPGIGVSPARNRGLSAARGDWLLFLDADDWIEPGHLGRMLEAVERQPDAVAAYCRWDYVRPDGRVLPSAFDPGFVDDPFRRLARSCYVAIHAVLVSRAAVENLGGFDESLKTCEDWDLWQRIARMGKPWAFVDELLSHYRVSANSLSRNLGQLLRDAETVIRRGYSQDMRVLQASERNRKGLTTAEGGSADLTISEVAIWYGTIEWMSGRDAEPAFSVLSHLPPPSAEGVWHLAGTIFYATEAALEVDAGELAGRWHDFGPRLEALIRAVGAYWNDPTATRRLQYKVESLVLERGDLSQPRQLGLTLGLPLFLGEPIQVPAGVDRLHLRLMRGPWKGSYADIGALGTVGRAQVLRLILEHYGPRRMYLAMPLRSLPGLIAKTAARLPVCLYRRLGKTGQGESAPAPIRQRLGQALWDAIIGQDPADPASHDVAFSDLRRSAESIYAGSGIPKPLLSPSGQEGPSRPATPALTAMGRENEIRPHMPVLMYHRIAEDGPEALRRYRTAPDVFEAQMQWLHRNGYHAIDSRQLLENLAGQRTFRGRPVLLTFDDGFGDFATAAWPILRRNGLTAEVFIVTDLVGKTSEWDQRVGGDFPLMPAQTITRLHAEGVRFGSHLATHRGADALSTQELAAELLRSRSALASWLGTPPASIAAPFGLTDKRMRQLAREAGYAACFTTVNEPVSLNSRPLDLPRLEVRGDLPMDDFVTSLERLL